MSRPSRFRSRTVQFLYDRYISGDPERVASFEQAAANSEIAQAIYDLRAAAGLTQEQLARRIGTTRSVISRLDDADYDGHSLSMLRRVALALGQRVELAFVPIEAKAPASPESRTASGVAGVVTEAGLKAVTSRPRARRKASATQDADPATQPKQREGAATKIKS